MSAPLVELIFELEIELDDTRRLIKGLIVNRGDLFEEGRLFGRGQALEELIKRLRGIK